MSKLFLIEEEEKLRILNLHESATKRQYLSEQQVYTVQVGDTLTKISSKFNVPVSQIAKDNNLSNQNVIRIGQKLNINSTNSPSPKEVSNVTSSPFKTKEEGNIFRNWVNDTYPKLSSVLQLDRNGSHTNSYIIKAWNHKMPDGNTLGNLFSKRPSKSPVLTNSKVKEIVKNEIGTEQLLSPNSRLMFDGDKLYWMIDGKSIKSWNAVSGLTWKNTPVSEWDQMIKRYTTNREEWAKDKNAGPLPEGEYSVGPLEGRTGNTEEISALEAFWSKITGQVSDIESDRNFDKDTLLSKISWGNFRIPITPIGNQNMYSRSSFYIHGGSIRGSHGCIDLTNQMDDFAKSFGIWVTTTKKTKIPLTVKYKNPILNQVINKLVNLF
jgi:LysM repeat protein